MENRTGGLHLRSRLLADGYTDDEIRRMSRRLVTVRPGAYVEPGDERLGTPESRHLLSVRAAFAQVGKGAVVSHVSAAVVHGIALWAVPLDRVHLTRPGNGGGRRSRHLHLHVLPLEPEEIVSAAGIAVTSKARTLADLLRSLPFEQAVVAADSALHRERTERGDVVDALARAPRRHGRAAAGRALAFANGLAESPGESRSRVAMWRAGLPPPALQVPQHAVDGRSLGRVDFWWEEPGVVGEFDGRKKYGRLLGPGQDAGDAVFAEKCREDALREAGCGMARWIWVEIHPFDGVARRLRRVLGTR